MLNMPFSMGSALSTEEEVAGRGGLAKGEGKDHDGHESGSPTPTQSRSETPTPVTARELMEMDFKTRPDTQFSLPPLAQIHATSALTLHRTQHFNAAIEALLIALSTTPSNCSYAYETSKIYVDLATVALELQDLPRAIDWLSEAIKLRPWWMKPRILRVEIWICEGRVEQAENEIRWIEMELEKVTPERRLREDGGDVTHWEKVSRAYRGSKRRKNVGELEVRAAIAPSRVS